MYDAENSIVFVVNHVREQFMRTGKISPKIKSAISKNLLALPEGHPFVGEFLNKYGVLSIPYPYPIDTLSEGYPYPSGAGAGEGKGEEGESEGRKLEGFEEFWREYPKKKSMGDAEKAWAKIKPSEHLRGVILSAVRRAKTSEEWLKEAGRYIPYPATWLNAKGWEDEYTTSQKPPQEAKPGTPAQSKWYEARPGIYKSMTPGEEDIELTEEELEARRKPSEPSPAMAVIKEITEGMSAQGSAIGAA